MSRKDMPLILVVDDTEANLDVMVEILQDDYEVAVATDGPGALEQATREPPDLILLDIMMPGMDGYEVCRRLKADPATSGIPVIFITAMTEVDDERKGFELGAVDYITKPVSPPIVLSRVATHHALSAARRTLEAQNTQLAKQNEQLRKYTQLRDEVERITRHDLKTPLNAVLAVPGMLAAEGNLTAEQVELLQMLEESGYRMLDIINSSMDLFRMEIGKYQLEPVPVEVLSLLGQIRGETRDILRSKDLQVRASLDGRPVEKGAELWLPGEKSLYYSMLANLLKNAVEASPPAGHIAIEFNTGAKTILRIHNRGAVPAEIRDCFFDKFVTAGKEGGTGLGTYSARLIARTLGGAIVMESSEARGTMITIELPPPARIGESAATPAAERTAPARGLPDLGMTILIVDDYSSMRRIIKGVLCTMGFTDFLEAKDGQQALNILALKRVGLIVSDVNMPNMTGISLLKNVRASADTADIPFLIVTGEADQESVVEAGKLGASGYILKPFTPDMFMRKVERVFGKTRRDLPGASGFAPRVIP